jgi:hypothetical protein
MTGTGSHTPTTTATGTLTVGDRVVDREQPTEDRSPALVLELPDETANERYIAAIGETVAGVNPDYPADSPIALVAFVDNLDRDASGWHEYPPDELREEIDRLGLGVTLYTYPIGRLHRLEPDDEDDPAAGGDRR